MEPVGQAAASGAESNRRVPAALSPASIPAAAFSCMCGATLWKTTYPDPGKYPSEMDAGDDQANDVAVAGENVYAAGRQMVDHGGSVDYDFLSLAVWR